MARSNGDLVTVAARMTRDVGVAEDLAQDALLTALRTWPETGVPDNPGAWLVTAGKRRAIDHLRRQKMASSKHEALAHGVPTVVSDQGALAERARDHLPAEAEAVLEPAAPPRLAALGIEIRHADYERPATLAAAFAVFGHESFHYVRELRGERDAVLEFELELDGIHINGVDMIRWNDEGQVTEFKVMLRPLKAVNLIHQKMAAMLQAAPAP